MGRKALKRLRNKRKLKIKRRPHPEPVTNDLLRFMMSNSNQGNNNNNTSELFNLRMVNNMKSQELNNYKKELEAELQKKKDIVNERDRLKKEYEKLESDFKQQKANDQENEKYINRTKEIQNKIEVQKIKNKNNEAILKQQQKALQDKIQVGQELENIKNENQKLEIDLYNLTNKRQEMRDEIKKKEELTYKNKVTQKEIDDLKIENETLLKMTQEEISSKTTEEARKLALDLAIERERNIMLKKANEIKLKLKEEELNNPIIPTEKLEEMNNKLINDIQTVYQKQLEYEEQLQANKIQQSSYDQLKQELFDQQKKSTSAYIDASKSTKYLESIKDKKLDEKRIKLMENELQNKQLVENNEREIELRKKLNAMAETKEATSKYLTKLNETNLDSFKDIIDKKTEVLKTEDEINEINNGIALKRKQLELNIDYNTRKKLYDDSGIITPFKEGNALLQQYNYQQDSRSRILEQQQTIHSKINNLISKNPNLWEKFKNTHTNAEDVYKNYQNYTPDFINSMGEALYNYIDSFEKAGWQTN